MENRYTRNHMTITDNEQVLLGCSHVLVAGLGGLGGYVLELLLRLGVGHITGADGDHFEGSNFNRQLLATESTLGMNKARAAAKRAAEVNPQVRFTPIEAFLDAEWLARKNALKGVQVLIDALGGLSQRQMLHQAAAQAGIPVVSAGIAGFIGWVKVIRPGEVNPVDVLAKQSGNEDDSQSVEKLLGNLAPVASFAASLQVVLTLKLLLGHSIPKALLVFDLNETGFYPVDFE